MNYGVSFQVAKSEPAEMEVEYDMERRGEPLLFQVKERGLVMEE